MLWGGVENCPFSLTKPVAVNTGLALPRSLWFAQVVITSGKNAKKADRINHAHIALLSASCCELQDVENYCRLHGEAFDVNFNSWKSQLITTNTTGN